MTRRSVHVLRPGLQTTIQDLGRWGFQAEGVGVAGPMDPFSHRLANALVGNSRDRATIEITIMGPELEFEGDTLIAIAGAEFDLTVDGTPVPHSCPFVIPSHGRLQFGERGRGARAYLAIDGGFDVPIALGSRSTHAPSAIGGWSGRSLQKGDRIPVGPQRQQAPRTISPRRANGKNDTIAGSGIVRVLAGPDSDRFAEGSMDALQSSPYSIEPDSDRMGFRLLGSELRHSRGHDIISDVTPVGTLQVPGSGQPILLMADRQTTGGYPRIATVIGADIGVAGQRAPGDQISFRVCPLAEALSALIARENALLAIEAAFS